MDTENAYISEEVLNTIVYNSLRNVKYTKFNVFTSGGKFKENEVNHTRKGSTNWFVSLMWLKVKLKMKLSLFEL